MTISRTTPREFLGREIMLAREARNLSQHQLAQEIYVSDSLVGAWEVGRRIPQPDHLVAAEQKLGTGGYLLRLREGLVRNEPLPEWMGRWREIEEQATSLLWCQPLLIPGLLQTEDYARAVITASGRNTGDAAADDQIQARMEQVVPLGAGAHPGLAGGFGIASMDGREYAYVDDAFSGEVLERPEDFASVKRVWETLRVEAMPKRQSIELLAKAAEKWKT